MHTAISSISELSKYRSRAPELYSKPLHVATVFIHLSIESPLATLVTDIANS